MLACKVGSTLICWLGRAKGGNKKGKKDKERVALGPEKCEGVFGRPSRWCLEGLQNR